jgi:hypothetical protein
MSDSGFSMRNIFAVPANSVGNRTLEHWPEMERNIANDFRGVNWNVAMPNVAPKIDELFDIEIPNVFVSAWNKANQIQTVRDQSRKSPEEVMYVELAEHAIVSEHHPYVEMSIKSSPPMKIVELTVKLSMTLKGFQLKIQNGEITEIGTGLCMAKGTIEYKGLVIKEKKLEPVRLPGSIRLQEKSYEAQRI